MLKINNIDVFYENIHAIRNLSLEIHEGEIVSLIGANGAGKTTTLNAISGLIKIKNGGIRFLERNIENKSPESILKLGIAHVPEGRKIFSKMTVLENLEIGAYTNKNSRKLKKIQEIYEMFPRLQERKNQISGTLSGGEQQMLAVGRALMSEPKFLMLDEPTMGLSPKFVNQVFEIIKNLSKSGVTIFLIEQNVNIVLSCSDRSYVIENGKIVLSGNSSDLISSDEIKKSYLGI
ncbi:MAG: ABC transporter ATP-binding protein [Clostridia bacterium]|nr:ABC transporter ATP-binding protein [Clostridia bacterium]